MIHAAESHCFNGGCTRPLYRGKKCFRCWAGDKHLSMVQRVNNITGKNPSYVGIPIGFSKEELIKWIFDSPPPKDMEKPSIDRIEPKKGYVPGNIRWLEFNKNCARHRWDKKEGHRVCPKCEKELLLNSENFTPNKGKSPPFNYYCRECKLNYDRKWRAKRAS